MGPLLGIMTFLDQRRSIGALRWTGDVFGSKQVNRGPAPLTLRLRFVTATVTADRQPEAQRETLRTPQNVPARTISWPDDPVLGPPPGP